VRNSANRFFIKKNEEKTFLSRGFHHGRSNVKLFFAGNNSSMGNYIQFYVHAIFAVKYRMAVLEESWEDRLQKYITGIVQNHGHKMLAVNNVYDHVHMFFGLNPNQSVSKLMQHVKGDSSGWINQNQLTRRKFNWQEGYGAFSVAKKDIDTVVKYIMNQREFHKTVSLQDEYHKILTDYGVEFDVRYTFQPLAD
jgi:putative transposase